MDGSKANKAATSIALSLSNEFTVTESAWHESVLHEAFSEVMDDDKGGVVEWSAVVATDLDFFLIFFCFFVLHLAIFSHLMLLLLLLGSGRSLAQLIGGC